MKKKYLVLAAIILVAAIAIFSNPTLLSGPGVDAPPVVFFRYTVSQ